MVLDVYGRFTQTLKICKCHNNCVFLSSCSYDSTLYSPDYLMTLASSKPASLSDVGLLVNADDQLNDTDRELLNLLVTEDDCSDILRKIADNESFENLIDDSAAFEPESVIASLTSLPDVLLAGVKEKKVGTFKCDHCGKLCTTKKLLKYHLMSHFGIREHSCEVCGKSFKHRYEVAAHKLTHAKPSFQCEVCAKMFIHKSHLNTHLRKHTREFVAYCSDCRKGFATQASYRYHVDNQHGKPEHICDKCGARLSSNSSLKEHLLVHEPDYGRERLHICELCGKTYLTGRNLRNHLRSHANEKSHHCHICGKSLSSKRGLQVHLKTHMGDKSFVCEFCTKGFTSKEYLTVHQRTHTGDRPFRCKTCGKCFTQKTSLNVHTRSHTGERPFKCHCGKSFITKTHLAAHLKTHEVANIDFSYAPQMLI
uniref:C2H2-type domain-containing protein n=1 Tax=Photinus pyralis TaxID=7054 RepID=A0A1Y1KYM3_PHOPY